MEDSNWPLISACMLLFQYTGDAAYIVDPTGRIFEANENCQNILGIDREDILGKTINDLWDIGLFDKSTKIFLGYDDTDVATLLHGLNENGLEDYNVEDAPRLSLYAIEKKTAVTGINKLASNGKIVLYVCIPVFRNDGMLDFVISIVRDLTDTMMLKSKLSKMTLDLEYLKSLQYTSSFIGSSPAMMRVKYLVSQAASSDATILISGETGTGKEVVAKEIFTKSNRRDKPYIRINCSAIPESLFESELFGYEKGAFTGALNTRKIGLLEMSNEGTILLDEIEDLPLPMQAKLLRVLQEQEIIRVGGNEIVKIDVRVIATSNKDLKQMVEDGLFRRDFYYRLNVISIHIPPLCERREDIVALAGTFLNRFNEKYKRSKFFEPYAITRLEAYNWPGNVRDLEHTVERLVVIGDQPEITGEDVELAINGDRISPVKELPNLQDMMDAYERQLLENAIKKYKSSRKTAEALGVSQPTILRKMKRLGISPK
ncbi:putative TyrR family transcriptional regulator [Oscillibacter valericigenes Sjm18-20]|nr:putative TyrR family transcriptional regulator [Oscillibacter valericigenes Sjm18-20]